MFHIGKVTFHFRDELVVGAACQDLGDVSAAGSKHLGREQQACLDQSHGPQVIRLLMANRIGRHV